MHIKDNFGQETSLKIVIHLSGKYISKCSYLHGRFQLLPLSFLIYYVLLTLPISSYAQSYRMRLNFRGTKLSQFPQFRRPSANCFRNILSKCCEIVRKWMLNSDLAPLSPLDKYKYGRRFVRNQLVTKFFWYYVVNHVDSFPASAKIKVANIQQICNPRKFKCTRYQLDFLLSLWSGLVHKE